MVLVLGNKLDLLNPVNDHVLELAVGELHQGDPVESEGRALWLLHAQKALCELRQVGLLYISSQATAQGPEKHLSLVLLVLCQCAMDELNTLVMAHQKGTSSQPHFEQRPFGPL